MEMGMQNPHNPEKTLWDAYMSWTDKWKNDPHNMDAKSSADYYYEQWEKQCEKQVTFEIREKRIKETAGDRVSRITKPRPDKLSSK
jgi:hypothetical protein